MMIESDDKEKPEYKTLFEDICKQGRDYKLDKKDCNILLEYPVLFFFFFFADLFGLRLMLFYLFIYLYIFFESITSFWIYMNQADKLIPVLGEMEDKEYQRNAIIKKQHNDQIEQL